MGIKYIVWGCCHCNSWKPNRYISWNRWFVYRSRTILYAYTADFHIWVSSYNDKSIFDSNLFVLLFYCFILRSFFFFRTTPQIDMWRDEFLKPFAHSVWILISVFIILISTLIKVAFIVHEKRIKKQITGSSSFLIAFGAICNQGV